MRHADAPEMIRDAAPLSSQPAVVTMFSGRSGKCRASEDMSQRPGEQHASGTGDDVAAPCQERRQEKKGSGA